MSVTGNLSVAALASIFPGLEEGPGRPKGKGGQEPLSDADPSFRLMKARPIRTSSRELYQTRSIKNPFADGKSCQYERYPQVDHRGQTIFFSIAAVHIICNIYIYYRYIDIIDLHSIVCIGSKAIIYS